MPARKTPSKKPENGHAFAVLVEEMRGQFRVFGEALSGLREEMGEALGGLRAEMGEALGGLRAEMSRRFDRVEGDIGLLKIAVVEHGRQLHGIGAKLDGKVDAEDPGPR